MYIVVLLIKGYKIRENEIENHLYAQMIFYALYSAIYRAVVFNKLLY